MFKRYIIILSLLFAFAYVPIYADECTDGLTEAKAKALYNSGNYQKANIGGYYYYYAKYNL